MALHSQFHSLAREYLGLLMTEKSARDEVSAFPDHDRDPEQYHARLTQFVNQRLSPPTPLPESAGKDFHRYVSERTNDFRQNLRAHTANAQEYELACDGYACRPCTH